MRWLILLLTFCWPVSASAIPLTYEFSSTFNTGGTVSGSFTYESTESPLATNVRGLSQNATYLMTSWHVSVVSQWEFLPDTIFTNTTAGNTLEFCEGNCVFGAGQTISLTFVNAEDLRLRVFWGLLDGTPFLNPANGLAEWGSFGELDYRIDPVPLMWTRTGTLTQRIALSEPSAAVLLVFGLFGSLAAAFIPLGSERA